MSPNTYKQKEILRIKVNASNGTLKDGLLQMIPNHTQQELMEKILQMKYNQGVDEGNTTDKSR